MGKPHNRKLQKQYQKEQTAAKKSKGNSLINDAKEAGPVYKVFKAILLMALPLLFGIFGLIMFPVNLGNSGNNTASETTATQRPAEGYCVGDHCPAEKGDDGRTPVTLQKQSHLNKRSDSSDSEIPAEIRDFQATILDHLTIQDVIVEGRKVKAVELTSEDGRKGAATRLYQFDGFLSDRECEGLKRVHQRHVAETSQQDAIICFDGIETLQKHLRDAGKNMQVSMKDFTQGTTCLNTSMSSKLKSTFHWSHSTSFYPGESKFSKTFDDRLRCLKGLSCHAQICFKIIQGTTCLNTSMSSKLKSTFHWSHSTSFYPGESKFSKTFEDRINQATGMMPSNGGKFQVTSYPKGIGYKSHTDCIVGYHDKRDRFSTILVYLQDVEKGGETQFPELGISVTPKKGRAIVWNNMNSAGECEPLSIHTAAKVGEGHKYIIQRWYYYKNFYQLGKRTGEPPIPSRNPGQPRVSCDEYEHGSCRWYDEWGYDHLVDYAAQKHDLKN